MTMRVLVNAKPALLKIASQDLTIRTLYKISKLMRKLDDELLIYETQRLKILGRHGEISGDIYVPKTGHEEDFVREFNELFAVEADIGDIKPVKIPLSENLKLSYQDLYAVRDFVEIEGDDENDGRGKDKENQN